MEIEKVILEDRGLILKEIFKGVKASYPLTGDTLIDNVQREKAIFYISILSADYFEDLLLNYLGGVL